MTVNSHAIASWKDDVTKSVAFYNEWFIEFAPEAYKKTRRETADSVAAALEATNYLAHITPEHIIASPELLPILRMSTVPPLARDRLIGLSQVTPSLIQSLEIKKRVSSKMDKALLYKELTKVCQTLSSMLDTDIFTWVRAGAKPRPEEEQRAAIIIADRLCGMFADPIIRNAQEKRQLQSIKTWLEARGYKHAPNVPVGNPREMVAGTFSFRLNIPVTLEGGLVVNIPVDTVIQPKTASSGDMPLLIEAKSAGDFTNTNKRRKEEAVKYSQLKNTYGSDVVFVLFLCGYFDSGYLGYEAAEGIDWVWEHRITDLAKLGL